MDKIIEAYIKILWDYNHVNHELKSADVIIGLGGYDLGIARRAIELYQNNFAPCILFSGNEGKFTKGVFHKTEAEVFADLAIASGVPEENILIESRSTNTGENIIFSKQLLEQKSLQVNKTIVVAKPYMERRAFATFKKHWPEVEVMVTSQQIDYQEYLDQIGMDRDLIINTIVADTQKIKLYSEKNYQIPQDMPDEVWQAWEDLVKAGYNKYII